MCTVTYIPTKTGFLLTSNRDEQLFRDATHIAELATEDGDLIYYPQDNSAHKGSWFCISSRGYCAVLLNGSRTGYQISPTFIKSRGPMVLHSFSFSNVDQFVDSYDFNGLAPFTLLLIRNENIHLLIFDGKDLELSLLNPHECHFFASATLYTTSLQVQKKAGFDCFIQENNAFQSSAEIIKFHKSQQFKNRIKLDVDHPPKTISITQVEFDGQSLDLKHIGLLTDQIFSKNISIGSHASLETS